MSGYDTFTNMICSMLYSLGNLIKRHSHRKGNNIKFKIAIALRSMFHGKGQDLQGRNMY